MDEVQIVQGPDGRYWAAIALASPLGELASDIALEPEEGARLYAATRGEPFASSAFESVGADAAALSAKLDAAAAARGTSARVLHWAKTVVRAHMGDAKSAQVLADMAARANAGDSRARKKERTIAVARQFAREILGADTAGSLFRHLGSSLERAARGLGHDVRAVGHAVGPVVRAIRRWGPMVVSDMQGVISLVPGIGTGISAAISTAEAVLSGGGPLSIAIHAAYGALPIPPGLRPIADTVLSTVLALVRHPKQLASDALSVIRDRIPKGFPQEIFDTLARVVARHHHHHGLPVSRPPAGRAAHARHAIARWTQGAEPALARAMPHVHPEIAAHLAELPDPSVEFQSIHQIAPHWEVNPADSALLIDHASLASGIALEPEQAAMLAATVAHHARTHADRAVRLRLGQHDAVRPHVPGTLPAAELAIQVSPDGQAARIHASPALAPASQTIQPEAAL